MVTSRWLSGTQIAATCFVPATPSVTNRFISIGAAPLWFLAQTCTLYLPCPAFRRYPMKVCLRNILRMNGFHEPKLSGRELTVLMPHFTGSITKGWFDKAMRWRRIHPAVLERLVLVAPSTSYIASLPYQKIPDRGDFQRFKQDERLQYWNQTIERRKLLAEAFDETLSAPYPLSRLATGR